MPTRLDLRLVPRVAAIIARLGTLYTFVVEGGTIDTDEGEVTGATTTPHTVRGTPPDEAHQGWLQDLLRSLPGGGDSGVAQFDIQLLIAGQGLAFTPKKGMRFSANEAAHGGKTYRIEKATPIATGDQVAAWAIKGKELG